jgi:SAM-dependent methyltransferase
MLQALKLKIPLKDEEFDRIYQSDIRRLSARHFTPFKVSYRISEWLNEYKEPLNVIDLGCGVGKFCFVASSFTKHKITGIDFRGKYIDLCNRINSKYSFPNLRFIHKNIIDLDFKEFNVFYFFNSFLEQIDKTAKIDDMYETSPMLYSIYETDLRNQLFLMPVGTIVITYHVFSKQVPGNFQIVKTDFDNALIMWMKK